MTRSLLLQERRVAPGCHSTSVYRPRLSRWTTGRRRSNIAGAIRAVGRGRIVRFGGLSWQAHPLARCSLQKNFPQKIVTCVARTNMGRPAPQKGPSVPVDELCTARISVPCGIGSGITSQCNRLRTCGRMWNVRLALLLRYEAAYIRNNTEITSANVRTSAQGAENSLLQLGVLGFGLLVYGDVRVGVFPEGEEVLVRGTGFGTCCLCISTLGGYRLERIGSAELKMRQRANGLEYNNTAMVENFLELSSSFVAAIRSQIGEAANVNRIEISGAHVTELIGSDNLEGLDSLLNVAAADRKLRMQRRQIIEADDCVLRKTSSQIIG